MDRLATRDDMHMAYSDTHKELYGFRPRDCGEWSFEDFANGLDMLAEESEAMHSAPAQGHGWAYDGDPSALEDF